MSVGKRLEGEYLFDSLEMSGGKGGCSRWSTTKTRGFVFNELRTEYLHLAYMLPD